MNLFTFKKNTYLYALIFLFNLNVFVVQGQMFGSMNYNKAVNISGKQRMLSQKMSKAYLLLTHGINNDEIKKELRSSKFIFEKQLQILKQNGNNIVNVKQKIEIVEGLWAKFKILIDRTPNRSTAAIIAKTNTDLLKACHQLALAIESSANSGNSFFNNGDQELVKTINKAGKQRMLSQRLALYYTAIMLFKSQKNNHEEILDATFKEYDNAIGDLLINSYNTTETEEELGVIMSEWESFQINKFDFFEGKFDLYEVFTTTNKMTKQFNKITGIYEKTNDNN